MRVHIKRKEETRVQLLEGRNAFFQNIFSKEYQLSRRKDALKRTCKNIRIIYFKAYLNSQKGAYKRNNARRKKFVNFKNILLPGISILKKVD